MVPGVNPEQSAMAAKCGPGFSREQLVMMFDGVQKRASQEMESPEPRKNELTSGQKLVFAALVGFVICYQFPKAPESLWRGIIRSVSPDDKRDIQGNWIVVMGEEAGKPVPVQDGATRMRMVIEDDSIRVVGPNGSLPFARFTLDSTRRAIDLFERKEAHDNPRFDAGIYQLSTNRLVLCIARPGRQRPKDFDSRPNNFHTLMILERE
jgi:uncharacterized protein (TIGR03067 family)